MVTGAQNALGQGSSPPNPGSATPITTKFARFNETLFPTIAGSAPKRLLHNSSLNTTTGLAPGALQSSSTKPRPRAGRSPTTSKNLQDVSAPISCSGLSPPSVATKKGAYASNPENT